ncbi:MAG: acyl-CoA dehydrogenase family protein [Acidimicrobiales bacterium]
MNPLLPDEALEFGAAAAKAFGALGGVDAARRAEDDPTSRTGDIGGALRALGVDELDPRADGDSLAAAAALCEASGRVALPYPVASVLLADADGRPFAPVPDGVVRVDHGDLFDHWVVAPLSGAATVAHPVAAPLGTRLGPFVVDLQADGRAPARAEVTGTDRDVLFHVVLTTASVLGTCDRAVELAVEHVNGRIQFGKPIASFQAVQFQLADCAVAVAGLRELTHFTLWRLDAHRANTLGDVLALRVHAIDVARAVLRTCQQLHGAAGVCDEYDISVLTRMVQPALRLPWSAERTATELAAAIQRDGFDGLFEHGQAS